MAGGEQRLDAPLGAAARDGETEQMLPQREVQFPPTIHRAHRRPLGVGPAPLLAGLSAGALILAIVMFALGAWIAGLVFLVLAATGAGLFLVAVRREPDSQSARLANTAGDRANGFVRLIAVTSQAATRAGVELAKAWHRRQRLRLQLRRRLTPLGEAVYRDDRAEAARLKAQAHELDEALHEEERRAAEAMAALRGQIERERATTQSTQTFQAVEQSGGTAPRKP
jgi:type IV secretory pathway TrbD component